MRDEVDLDALSRELLATVAKTVQPAQAGCGCGAETIANPR